MPLASKELLHELIISEKTKKSKEIRDTLTSFPVRGIIFAHLENKKIKGEENYKPKERFVSNHSFWSFPVFPASFPLFFLFPGRKRKQKEKTSSSCRGDTG
jgi:hypothetical protein